MFGGVVPEIASRAHTTAILTATDRALKTAGKKLADIDAVAVTYGAGLLGALLAYPSMKLLGTAGTYIFFGAAVFFCILIFRNNETFSCFFANIYM